MFYIFIATLQAKSPIVFFYIKTLFLIQPDGPVRCSWSVCRIAQVIFPKIFNVPKKKKMKNEKYPSYDMTKNIRREKGGEMIAV